MNEAAENGSSLWPIITFGIYWAYLIATYEQRKRKGGRTFFGFDPSPPGTGVAHEYTPGWLTFIIPRETDLDEEFFLTDAIRMYEFILENYAAGNTARLVGLLSADVFEVFSNHIEDRATRGESLSLDIAALSDARIVALDISTTMTEFTVRFEADIFVSRQDISSDYPRKGSPELLKAIDVWVFQKRADAANKSWILVATESGTPDPAGATCEAN